MGHEMHILEGFVLDSNPYGESGRILKILTKEFGVMSVVATGVRELHSKMRGSLDILQLVTFEYVEGREVNRLTGIHEKQKFENLLKGAFVIEKRRVVSNIVSFVLRTVVGETKNDTLWESFLLGLQVLNGESDMLELRDKQDLQAFEIIWLIKILVALGYWAQGRHDKFTDENLDFFKIEDNNKALIDEINTVIKSTHM